MCERTHKIIPTTCLNKKKNRNFNCNIPISDENITCPNKKQLFEGDGHVGNGEDCMVWMIP